MSDSPAAASPSASPAAATATNAEQTAPVETFIPSHTRSWTAEQRSEYQLYVEQHELSAITPIVNVSEPKSVSTASADAIQAAIASTSAFLSSPPSVDTLEARGRIIQNGDQAICDSGRGKAWINFDGAPGKTIYVGKATAKVSNLVGQPYGQIWELEKNGTLTRTSRKRGLGTALLDPTMTTSKNNSQLFDRNESQKLTQTEIEQLKATGSATPQELVDMLVSNSTTFASKTEFSQEKYIKKKKAKHCSELSIQNASLSRVLETFWEKDPKKARGMRPDTIAMMLSYANIQAGTNSLVVESCGGQILGSMLYRQQGLGYVIHGFEHNQKRTEGVKRFNFADNIHQALLHIPLDRLLARSVQVVANDAPKEDVNATAMDTSSSSSGAAVVASDAGELTAEYILAHQVDVIILATKYDPFALLSSLWPYLKPAGRFVIYDEVLESLSHCHAKVCQGALGGSESATNLILAETFFRNIQVLPNRTHPFVNMSASGGYLLTGIKMNAKQPTK